MLLMNKASISKGLALKQKQNKNKELVLGSEANHQKIDTKTA